MKARRYCWTIVWTYDWHVEKLLDYVWNVLKLWGRFSDSSFSKGRTRCWYMLWGLCKVFRKVFGTCLQVWSCIGKGVANVFDSLDKFLEIRLEHFWKCWVLLEACFGNVLESSGKLFVEKLLVLLNVCLLTFFGKITFGKSLEQFWEV